MSDIFISYSNEDRGRAGEIAARLEQEGWSVFWDRTIPVGSTWDEMIENELKTMKVMVVLWSSSSVKSKWVRTEAEVGESRNMLVPVLLEEVELPIRFRAYQAADISGWILSGPDTLGIRQFIDAIARIGHLKTRKEIELQIEKGRQQQELLSRETGEKEKHKEKEQTELKNEQDPIIKKPKKLILSLIVFIVPLVLALSIVFLIWRPWTKNTESFKDSDDAKSIFSEATSRITEAKNLFVNTPISEITKDTLEAIWKDIVSVDSSLSDVSNHIANGSFPTAFDKAQAARDKAISIKVKLVLVEVTTLVTEVKDLFAKSPKKGKDIKETLEAILNDIAFVEVSFAEVSQLIDEGYYMTALDKAEAARDKASQLKEELEEVITKKPGK